MKPDNAEHPRVLIVAENASARFGGEAILPLHYFRFLRARGVDARLVVHERVRAELEGTLAGDLERVHFVRDTKSQSLLWRVGTLLPKRVAEVTVNALVHLSTGMRQRKLVRRLVAEHDIELVHQPAPVSPKQPSSIHSVGAPVVIGPMNGGMVFPPAFAGAISRAERVAMAAARCAANLANRMIPGKRRASLLLVANQRTRAALPANVTTPVVELVENGVDLSLWTDRGPGAQPAPTDDDAICFTYLGFLRDWKAVDLLLLAAARVIERQSITLRIVGDGPERAELELLAEELGIRPRVEFCGFVPQHECHAHLARSRALVLPSLYECGGAVVLEAMCTGIPVIATNWGGPVDYLTEQCGILVDPSGREEFVAGLADAMTRLADDGELARSMGAAGQKRAMDEFSWDAKIVRMLEIYAEVLGRCSGPPPATLARGEPSAATASSPLS